MQRPDIEPSGRSSRAMSTPTTRIWRPVGGMPISAFWWVPVVVVREHLEEFCAPGTRAADHRERVRDAAGQQDEATRSDRPRLVATGDL